MGARRRRHFYLAMAVMLVGALAELMTIGAVIPFLALVADPDAAANLPGFQSALRLIGAETTDNLVLIATLLLVGSAIFSAAVRLLLTWISYGFVLILSHEVSTAVFYRVMRQPYSFYVTRNTSVILAGVEKIHTVIWSVLMPAMQGGIAAVMALGIIGMLFAIDPLTAFVASAAMGIAYLGVSLAVRKRLRRNSEIIAQYSEIRIKTIQEGLGGMRDVLLDQSQHVFDAKYTDIDYRYRRTQVVNNFITVAPRYFVEATGIVLIAILAYLLSTSEGGIVSAIPVLGALTLGAQRLLPLLQQTYNAWSSFAGNRQFLLDVVEQMRTPVVTSVPRDLSAEVRPFSRQVVLKDVSFEYPLRGYVLRNIELTIRKGARIGFVGETGSGKSTLLDLIMGLLEPSSGVIEVDGKPLSDQNRAHWQAQIAHVPQAIYLTDSSISSNIAFGFPEAQIDEARVAWAAETAQLHSFLSALPDGYETLVGERGVRLSGGQRQRIGIARALYKGPSVLILDEATSALDSKTEAEIMHSIGRLGGDITILMVAHRVTTLSGCDEIVRLEDGEIVENGSYEEVLLSSPAPKTADRR